MEKFSILEIVLKNILKWILNILGFSYKFENVETVKLETITLLDLFEFNKQQKAIEIFKFDTEGYQSVFIPPFIDELCERAPICLLEMDNPEQLLKFNSTNDKILQLF